MAYKSRLVTYFSALVFGVVHTLPAYSQSPPQSDAQSASWIDRLLPEDFYAHFGKLLSLPVDSPEFELIKGSLKEIQKFESDEHAARDKGSPRPSSADVLKKIPSLKDTANRLSRATHNFSLRVQAGDLRGLVDDKIWAKCGDLPQQILDNLLAKIPADPNGVPQIPPDQIKTYQAKLQSVDDKQFQTCKNLIADTRRQLEQISIESQKRVDDLQKQIDDISKKETKTKEDLDKLKSLQDQQGVAKQQHDQAEEGKRGADGWKQFLGVVSIIAGVVLCALDDPIDGLNLIAAGFSLLAGDSGDKGNGSDGKGNQNGNTPGEGGGTKSELGKKLVDAQKDGTVKPEDIKALESKFGGSAVDSDSNKGTVILLFDASAKTLKIVNTLSQEAPLFTVNLNEVKPSTSWTEQSNPSPSALSEAHKWSYRISNGYIELYLQGTFGAQHLDLALIEEAYSDGHFVAVNDVPPRDVQ